MTFSTQVLVLAAPLLAADEETTEAALSGGLVGSFVAFAAVAIALFFLGFDLVRRLRRAKYRDEISKELAAEVAERDAARAGGSAESQSEKGAADQNDGRDDDADPRPEADAQKG